MEPVRGLVNYAVEVYPAKGFVRRISGKYLKPTILIRVSDMLIVVVHK